MLHLLIPFIPAIKNTVVKHLLGEDVNKKDVKELSKKLYSQIPFYVKVVDEETFVSFCVKHQNAIFPRQEKKKLQKPVGKTKVVTKKVAAKKKAVSKKTTAKKK